MVESYVCKAIKEVFIVSEQENIVKLKRIEPRFDAVIVRYVDGSTYVSIELKNKENKEHLLLLAEKVMRVL